MGRIAPPGPAESVERARSLDVGNRVRFFGESQARFKVSARGDRYIILTKPFNPRKTVLYTVIDLELGIRGTDDCLGSLGYESEEQIERALRLLEAGEFEISVRNNVSLRIADVK
jgi:hypothetical protein